MKLLSAALMAAALLLITSPSAFANRLNPQVSLNVLQYADQLSTSLEDRAQAGFGVGGFLRLGDERVFFQPGVFYQENTIELFGTDATLEEVEEDLAVSSVFVPLQLGFRIVGDQALALRGGVGAAATFVTAVDDNPLGVNADDYEDVIFGALFGAGVDIGFVTADLSLELGLTGVYDSGEFGVVDEELKQNVWRLSAGFLF